MPLESISTLNALTAEWMRHDVEVRLRYGNDACMVRFAAFIARVFDIVFPRPDVEIFSSGTWGPHSVHGHIFFFSFIQKLLEVSRMSLHFLSFDRLAHS